MRSANASSAGSMSRRAVCHLVRRSRFERSFEQPASPCRQCNSSCVSTHLLAVDGLNVRDRPSVSGNVVATYSNGQTVNLDHWGTVADGYIWGRYTAYSGAVRYIALAPADKSTWYLVKA